MTARLRLAAIATRALIALLCATPALATPSAETTRSDAALIPEEQFAQAAEQPPSPAAPDAKPADAASALAGDMTLDQFLDRLMLAESGGRADAKNPRSTALGAFQFIASTWFQVSRQALADVIAELSPIEILALRTDPELSRRAAKSYTEDNAAYLVSQGHKATFPHLRLAFLVGPGGAVRVLSAKPETPVSTLLGAVAIGANPFMGRMTAEDLIARCARDIETDVTALAGLTPDEAALARAKSAPAQGAKPRIAVRCELSLPSCRRWLALQTRKAARTQRAGDGDKKVRR